MIAIPYLFQDYTIKPKVMRIIPDQSVGAIPVIQEWVVLKDEVEISTPSISNASRGVGMDRATKPDSVRDHVSSLARSTNELLHTLKHDGYEAAHESLLTGISPLRGPKRAAAKRLLAYITERREMINYPEFLANGWQIGSGPTEARCRTSTARLKHSGARWDRPNVEAVSALTNLRDSDQWQIYLVNFRNHKNLTSPISVAAPLILACGPELIAIGC